MDGATTVIVVIGFTAAKTTALLGIWLHLRSRARRDRTQSRNLRTVAEAIAAGGQAEFDDQRADGERLRLTITRAPAGGEDRAA